MKTVDTVGIRLSVGTRKICDDNNAKHGDVHFITIVCVPYKLMYFIGDVRKLIIEKISNCFIG